MPGHLVIRSDILFLGDGEGAGRQGVGRQILASLFGEPSVSSREERCNIVADRPGAVSQGAQASLYSVENGGGKGEYASPPISLTREYGIPAQSHRGKSKCFEFSY